MYLGIVGQVHDGQDPTAPPTTRNNVCIPEATPNSLCLHVTTTRLIIDTMHRAIPAPAMNTEITMPTQSECRKTSVANPSDIIARPAISTLSARPFSRIPHWTEDELGDRGREHVQTNDECVRYAEEPPRLRCLEEERKGLEQQEQKPMKIAVTLASRTPRLRNIDRRTIGSLVFSSCQVNRANISRASTNNPRTCGLVQPHSCPWVRPSRARKPLLPGGRPRIQSADHNRVFDEEDREDGQGDEERDAPSVRPHTAQSHPD